MKSGLGECSRGLWVPSGGAVGGRRSDGVHGSRVSEGVVGPCALVLNAHSGSEPLFPAVSSVWAVSTPGTATNKYFLMNRFMNWPLTTGHCPAGKTPKI